MMNFCTLFDSHYLSRGLTLYNSLKKQCASFHLYVVAFDEKTLEVLSTLKPEHLTVISLQDFENKNLLAVKPLRSKAEYCWTCTPSTVRYCLDTFQLSDCTYIDADLYFYNDPEILKNEMGDASVSITPHNFSASYKEYSKFGKYCVQFMTFKNNEEGRKVLEDWEKSCLDWCYAKLENNRFGDQKYLDEWPHKFSSVYEINNPGSGIAPWNVQQYRFDRPTGNLTGIVLESDQAFKPIFYHFHGLKFFKNNLLALTTEYLLNANCRQHIYYPYLIELDATQVMLAEHGFAEDVQGVQSFNPPEEPALTFKNVLKYFRVKIKQILS